jgi:hypothetical protein
MTITAQSIDFCIDILSAQVAEKIAIEKCIPLKDAVKQFMSTKTHTLLIDKESLLYLESVEYILDMLNAEETGSWDEWLEV